MRNLTDTTTIKSLSLKNRFVRSATWEGLATGTGHAGPALIRCMTDLVDGGVGLIITGHAFVSPEGQASPGQLSVCGDDFVPDLLKMTDAVHEKGGKIVLQLAHAGLQAPEKLTGTPAGGPSVLETEKGAVGKEMGPEEILGVVDAFGDGALRAKRAGFDGVQIHAAHGYLLSQFLSPFFNRRRDEYGGKIENRVKIVLSVLRKIRSRVGDDYPVMIKINSEDFLDGGFTADEMLLTCGMLEKEGMDAVELSGGTPSSGKRHPVRKIKKKEADKELFYLDAARAYKKRIRVPLMLVGGIRRLADATRIVEEDAADYISLCRPLIREPGLIKRWTAGETAPATCISCNKCFVPAMKGDGLKCVVEEKLRKKQRK